jgi:hypothetical protein
MRRLQGRGIPEPLTNSIHSCLRCRDQLFQPSKLLAPLLCDLPFRELSCLALEHGYPLIMSKLHLSTHRHQAACDVIVVLPQQVDGQHHVIDVVEHKRVLIGVLLLLR